MVSLEWYRSFVEVYRVGTVSGAAQVLHLTQPAVSQHVAGLESALDYPLFQRMPRRMVPTEAGKRLYTEVIAAIERLESITAKTTTIDAPKILRIGTPQEFFAEMVLHRLPQSFQWLYRIHFGLTGDAIAELLEGRLDAVIATQKIARTDLEYQLIYEESFWLVTSPRLEISFLSNLPQLEEYLRTQPLIAYGEDLPIIRRFWRVVFGKRLDMVPRIVLPDLRLIQKAITLGNGFSVLPDYLCERAINSGELQLLLKPTDAVTNQIWLAYRKSERESQSVQLLLNELSRKGAVKP
ncbi:LysR family transcriptional regulator [Dulcicalothrix desertica PCC 7102]|uniref:LysR family transcriptional regulator n=1 Tax=Dulcicalothrix desertica PCC 7102 TaxID=232991 RepID=A0A433URX5_9CYAN|nr:LysR family transcriptional regulator [Dulcicalothrix desertica]RUS96559.1 LysR family transcriptional regulator [Dulcicalothrix desertica PCC 7102]TWH51398.1 DNA-binding transcriptional LysR family regulator [Dulcicalothrix desertica PCC 7102]